MIQKTSVSCPRKRGIQTWSRYREAVDSRFRGNDGMLKNLILNDATFKAPPEFGSGHRHNLMRRSSDVFNL